MLFCPKNDEKFDLTLAKSNNSSVVIFTETWNNPTKNYFMLSHDRQLLELSK